MSLLSPVLSLVLSLVPVATTLLTACMPMVAFAASRPAVPAAAPSEWPLTLRDDRGAAVVFAAAPRRIVSLLPSLTESLCALGGCARLVGTDRYSDWPASVNALPKLGGLEDAQIERIVALRPDVVLASPAPRLIGRLEALGVKVLAFDSNTRADVDRSLRALAGLIGRPSAAAEVEATIERDLRAAAARVPKSLLGRRVYFEIDSAPYAAGVGSFIDETLAALGLVNVLPAALGPFPKLNPEYVVALQPDLVMAAKSEIARMAGRPGWSSLKALRDGDVCGYAAGRYELLIRPGPRLGEAAGVIADCLAGLPTSVAPGAAR